MATVVQLLAVPYDAQAAGTTHRPTLTKSPPYFEALDTEIIELGERPLTLLGREVVTRWQVIDEDVLSIEATFTLDGIVDHDAPRRRQAVQSALRDEVLHDVGYQGGFVEEYTIVCIDDADTTPDDYLDAHLTELAALVRSESRGFTREEAAAILASRVRFSTNDLTAVDWEGAIILDSDADFRSEIELLKLGNSQVLRYRLLDSTVDRSLHHIRLELQGRRRFGLGSRVLRQALEQRLELLLDFEQTEQLLLLIGDWYSAQLYAAIVDEFYIDDWKAAVRAKLGDLQSITDSVRANFSLGWQQLLDLVQLVGWFLLLVGYFVLFWFESRR